MNYRFPCLPRKSLSATPHPPKDGQEGSGRKPAPLYLHHAGKRGVIPCRGEAGSRPADPPAGAAGAELLLPWPLLPPLAGSDCISGRGRRARRPPQGNAARGCELPRLAPSRGRAHLPPGRPALRPRSGEAATAPRAATGPRPAGTHPPPAHICKGRWACSVGGGSSLKWPRIMHCTYQAETIKCFYCHTEDNTFLLPLSLNEH